MTPLSAEVAEALHEADICATLPSHYNDDAERAAVILAAEVRRLHARVRELELQLKVRSQQYPADDHHPDMEFLP